MSEQSRRRWFVGVIVIPVLLVAVKIADDHFEIRVRQRNTSTITVPPPSTGTAESASTERDALLTLAGKWTSVGDCNYAMTIRIRNGYIEVRQAVPEEPLADRYQIDGREGSAFVGNQEGITAKFSRDGDKLVYVRGGQQTEFTRCE